MYSESFLTELAERNDIAEVVGSYVRLGKRSGSNMFGLCPFHNEKTPSFSVSPDKQIYHCFGCGKGGGVINFIMEIEGLSFPEAVEFLAKRAGMTIPDQEDDKEGQKRKRMYALNRDAARFFYDQISTPAGKKARDYMDRRAISPTVAKNFGLGFAPDTWDSLRNAMKAKGYTDFELLDADLVRRGKSGGFYDTFRNRLVFPVIDVRGNVIGFSGRILGDGEPKYLNSKDTFVFTKGKNLYGLNLAKKSKAGYILLVEGNVDVVSLHQAGFDSAIASLGTSLTPEQARLISRYTNEVIIAYDSDGAGLKASQRAIDILSKLDVKVKVLRMQGAKDPDEYIKSMGAGAFRNLIEKSESQIDYRLANIESKYNLSVPEQKVDFLREASRLVAGFPGEVERQVYSLRIAQLAGVSGDVVAKEVERQRRQLVNRARKDDFREQTKAAQSAQPADRGLRYENLVSATAEEGVIRLLYLEPALYTKILLSESDFTSPALGHIFSVLFSKAQNHSPISVSSIGELLPPEEMNLLISLLQKPEILSNSESALADYLTRIKDQKELSAESTDLRDLANKLKDKGKGYK